MGLPRSIVIGFRVALAAALVIVTHLATTAREYPGIEAINDKLSHVLAFCVLAFLEDFSFPENAFSIHKSLTLLGYGLLLEVIQYFLPYRSFSLLDLTADGVGILLYWSCLPILRRVPQLQCRWSVEE